VEKNLLAKNGGKGFTVVELLMTVTVIGILAIQAIPSFNQLIQSVRIRAASSDLERTLRLGRRHALARGELIRLCPSVDGDTCTLENKWQAGWIMFADRAGGTRRDPDDPILLAHDRLTGLLIEYNRGTLLSFNSRGRISRNGSFHLCMPSRPEASVRLVMIHSGRLRLEQQRSIC